MKLRAIVWGSLLLLALCGCTASEPEMQDGYYSAEAASFDAIGWKKFVNIYVSDNQILTVEYDSRDASGFIKSWDMDYMRDATNLTGTYPSQYARIYSESLVNRQNLAGVDAVSGATQSYISFQLLSRAAIEQAKAGDKTVAVVVLPDVPYAEGLDE